MRSFDQAGGRGKEGGGDGSPSFEGSTRVRAKIRTVKLAHRVLLLHFLFLFLSGLFLLLLLFSSFLIFLLSEQQRSGINFFTTPTTKGRYTNHTRDARMKERK